MGGNLTVEELGPTVGNFAALEGGVFYTSGTVSGGIITLHGSVISNFANKGSFFFTDALAEDFNFSIAVATAATEWRGNNVGSILGASAIIHCGSKLTVTLNTTDVHHNDCGIFLVEDGSLHVCAQGSTFRHNDGAIAVTTASNTTSLTADRDLEFDEPGEFTSNEVPSGCLLSAGRNLIVRSLQGDVGFNRAPDGIFCATADSSLFYSASVTFNANRGPLMSSTQAKVAFSSASMDNVATVENNRGSALFIGANVRVSLNGGAMRGNQAPLAAIAALGSVDFRAGNIMDTIAPEDPQRALFEIPAGGFLSVIADEGICNNAGGETSPYSFVGHSGPLASIEVHTGDQFGIDGTTGGMTGLLEEATHCLLNTTRVLSPHAVPEGCLSAVPLRSPYSISASGPPVALLNEYFNVTVNVTTAVIVPDKELIVKAVVDNDSFINAGESFKSTVDGVVVFLMNITSATVTSGNPQLRFTLPGLCPPLTALSPVIIVVPQPSPSSSPTVLPTPSISKSRTLLRTGIVALSPVKTLSVGVTSIPRVSPSPSVSPTKSQSESLSPRKSRTPLPVAPGSPLPSPSRSRSTSRSRSPSGIPLQLPSRSCLAPNCVKPTVTLLDPTITQQQIPFTDNNGNPAGTVLVPANAIQPGEVLLVGPASEEAEIAAEDLDVASEIVQVTLTDIFGDTAQPGDEIEICLEVSDADRAKDDGCLSFFDEDRGVWVCEDPCLELDGSLACGTTDHFTNFAVLFGEGGGSSRCGSSSEDYILNAAWQDGLLVGGVFTAAVLVCVVVIFIGLLFPRAVGRLHGKEYSRIRSLRTTNRSSATAAV